MDDERCQMENAVVGAEGAGCRTALPVYASKVPTAPHTYHGEIFRAFVIEEQ